MLYLVEDQNDGLWSVRWNVGNSSSSSSWRHLSITCSWPRMQSKWHTITNRIPAAANEEPGRISTTPLDAAPGGPTKGSAVNCGSDCDTNSDGCFYFLFAQSDAGILHYLGPSSTLSSNVWCARLSVPHSSAFIWTQTNKLSLRAEDQDQDFSASLEGCANRVPSPGGVGKCVCALLMTFQDIFNILYIILQDIMH